MYIRLLYKGQHTANTIGLLVLRRAILYFWSQVYASIQAYKCINTSLQVNMYIRLKDKEQHTVNSFRTSHALFWLQVYASLQVHAPDFQTKSSTQTIVFGQTMFCWSQVQMYKYKSQVYKTCTTSINTRLLDKEQHTAHSRRTSHALLLVKSILPKGDRN